jgi:hypothetical protein
MNKFVEDLIRDTDIDKRYNSIKKLKPSTSVKLSYSKDKFTETQMKYNGF